MEQTSRTKRGYRGGKAGAGVYQKLINLMPPHTVYIEPFLGHGAILLHKRPARLSIGLDLDARAVQEVRTRVQHRQRASICSTPVPDGGAGTHDVSDGVAGLYPFPDDAAGADLPIGHARYRLLVADALDFLRSYPFTGNELLYADPPYVRSTRRTRARAYRYEMDDSQHGELLALLRRLPCAVMVSGYRSALYEQTLEDWRSIEFQAQTRGGPATEVVWMNYEERPARHEYTYLGDNFHAREQITRVQGRWVQKLLPKPETEQTALLLAQLTRVGPTVRDAVLRSALTQYGDEDLTVSNGVSGSHHWQGNGAAAQSAPTMLRASRCTICRHAARQRIDQALAAGASVREVAQREGLSKSVLGRHRAHGVGREVSQKKWDTPPAHKRPAVMSKPTPGGILYAIGAPGTPYVKIGMTRTPVEKRLGSLQSGYPAPLQVFAAVAIPANLSTIEAYVHAFLHKERRRGEWFEVEIADNAQLEAVIASAMQYAAEQEAETATYQESTQRSVQLELLSLDTLG